MTQTDAEWEQGKESNESGMRIQLLAECEQQQLDVSSSFSTKKITNKQQNSTNMSNYYPKAASSDSDPIDYYYDMSGEDCPLGEESRNATSIPSWTRRNGTRAFSDSIFVLISGSLLIVGLAAILDLQHQHTFAEFGIGSSSNNRETYGASIQEESGEVGYGVDVSWPIEGPLHMHKEPFVFGEGTRHNAYMEHLQGCRSFYKQVSQTAARTCDLFEFDRLLMNKRQPQSMEVSALFVPFRMGSIESF